MRELIKKLTPKPLLYGYKKIRHGSIVVFFYLCRILPIKRNRVVLMNVWGFGDNTKYVTEELARRNLPLELIFVCNHPVSSGLPQDVRVLKTNTLPSILALATAKVWVDSNRKEGYVRKRRGQYYIQLWHGGLALKKIERDCANYLGKSYCNRAKRDSDMTNLYVSNGTFCTRMYKNAFWYQGEIKEWGSPRMDQLLLESTTLREKIKEALSIPTNKKVVLYAPTYRDGTDITVYDIECDSLCKVLGETFGGEWVAIERLHPLVQQLRGNLKEQETCIDGSTHKDMYELMLASDVLITDYSNTMFEFAMINRPVFLYALDIASYQKERGLYFEYQSLPFPIAATKEELYTNIRTFQKEPRTEAALAFLREQGVKESGKASAQVANRIIEVIEGN